MHTTRTVRNARTSTLIAAYRREPIFPGDITWEMAMAIMPFDKRPCHILWDEDTVRYHIAPYRTPSGEIEWLPYCQEGAHHWGTGPIFLVGLGISDYSEEDIWKIVNKVVIRPRNSLQSMYKDWVWDVLPVSVLYSCLIYSRSPVYRLLQKLGRYMHVMGLNQVTVPELNSL